MNCGKLLSVTLLLSIICVAPLWGTILSSKHNLSISGTGDVKATIESRVCIFCHTPHNGRKHNPFLWNREDQRTTYIPYQSSTMYAAVGQPTGTSKLCLSCHDGTIALGAILSMDKEISFLGGIRSLPPERRSYLGTDLSDDHPVSFYYDSSTEEGNSELIQSAALPQEIRLDNSGQLQCTSCHDPHEDTWGNFLVMSNQFSQLCISCHVREQWMDNPHAISGAQLPGDRRQLWPSVQYNTVAENGCCNCHQPHSAATHQRLLKSGNEEDNCLACHNGSTAEENIELELSKPYLHPVQEYRGVHDAAERFSSGVEKHVECVDCHNPHQINSAGASAPDVSGKNSGVSGVNSSGQEISGAGNLYEICYKCHADNNVLIEAALPRQIQQLNTRFEFSPGNPSSHPILAVTGGSEVPSLRPPYNSNSIIYCTDCHGSDDPGGPQGPHGSMYEHLLVARYETDDMTRESESAYALCYTCHDRSIILSSKSGFTLHRKHIKNENSPCAVCHDPHGVSATQGNHLNNSYLINFDVSVVSPNSAGDLYFEDLGRGNSKCALRCHGIDHYMDSNQKFYNH